MRLNVQKSFSFIQLCWFLSHFPFPFFSLSILFKIRIRYEKNWIGHNILLLTSLSFFLSTNLRATPKLFSRIASRERVPRFGTFSLDFQVFFSTFWHYTYPLLSAFKGRVFVDVFPLISRSYLRVIDSSDL